MRLHELSRLSKKNSQSMFSKKNHIKIKITKIGKNIMSITQIFMVSKPFAWRLHTSGSQKKIMFMLGNKCIDKRPSQRVNLLLSRKVKGLWYLYLLARLHRTQSPHLYSFIGLKVLTHRTQSPHLYLLWLKILIFIFHMTQSPRIGLKVLNLILS